MKTKQIPAWLKNEAGNVNPPEYAVVNECANDMQRDVIISLCEIANKYASSEYPAYLMGLIETVANDILKHYGMKCTSTTARDLCESWE